IAYSSTMNGNMSIWIMDADGSNKKQLTADGQINGGPSVSPDGRYIGFISDRSGAKNIWRMDIDGGNPIQLTNNSPDSEIACSTPRFSPDGRWLLYESNRTIWKAAIDGGDSVLVSDKIMNSFDISPDGKRIAYHYRENNGKVLKRKAAVIPFEGGEPIKIFEVPASAFGMVIGWTPDGQALTYINAGNLWSLPLVGGPPEQLIDFKSDGVVWFERSRDGKQLAFVRFVGTKDVVLITNFK